MPKLIKNSKGFTLTSRSEGAFTLIELLVVISIIAILATIGFVNYQQAVKKGRDSRRAADLKVIQTALEQYHTDNHHYTPGTSLPWGSQLDNRTGLTGGSVTKIYLKVVPNDPKSPATYVYGQPTGVSNCNSTTPSNCTDYCVYANLEDPTGYTKPSVCTNGSYNYAVTRP